jgi:hypothetical protein
MGNYAAMKRSEMSHPTRASRKMVAKGHRVCDASLTSNWRHPTHDKAAATVLVSVVQLEVVCRLRVFGQS